MKAINSMISAAILAGATASCSSNPPPAHRNTSRPENTVATHTDSPTSSNNANLPISPATPANGNMSFAERRAEAMRRKMSVIHPGSQEPLDFRPAGENSEIATTMNPEGRPVEVRVFKSDTNIARVESTWLDAHNRSLKFTLKDGSSVEVKTDKINSIADVTAAQLAALLNGR